MKKNISLDILKLKYKGVKGYIRYFGRKNINLSFSSNLKKWRVLKRAVLEPRPGYFDTLSLSALNPLLIKEGILLLYFVKDPLSLGAALFSKKNPQELLWRSANPLWETAGKIRPLGAKKAKRNLIVYFGAEKGEVKKIVFPLELIFAKESSSSVLEKAAENPILGPIAEHPWESQYVFNPAAVYLEGRVHLVYRAIGGEGLSVLGYASSNDGVYFDERLDKPVYIPTQPFEHRSNQSGVISYHFMSGGGYGGCEDPRLTQIDDIIYMTYIAFNGSDPPRVALTSIKVDDFLNKRWRWKRPVLISPPGQVHKNWVIFPERKNGKYALLHSLCPKVLITYLDSLEFDGGKYINSFYNGVGRRNCWDSWIRGAGPPPLKTKDGWLLLYHAMDNRDPGRYKLGAMILDFKDPSRVLYRSEKPILEPDKRYENEGFKAGVVYTCGAVIVGNQLFIYYGGADTVVCVATAELDRFLDKLKSLEAPRLELIVKPGSKVLKYV